MSQPANLTAWLVRMSGPLAGTRYLVRDSITRVGRSSQNDVPLVDCPTVSVHHLEIRKQGADYKIHDLNSTNGTFVNGERVTEAVLKPPCNIQLGKGGPELTFLLDDAAPVQVNETLVAHPSDVLKSDAGASAPEESRITRAHDDLLVEAVARSRMVRHKGIGDQTLMIMRQTLDKAIHRTRRKFVKTIAVLAALLLAVSGFGLWKILALRAEKQRIDAAIRDIEAQLQRANQNAADVNELYDRLSNYEDQARGLEKTFLYRVSMRRNADPIEQEVKRLLAEFGAETYTIPPDFLEQVKRFIQRYQGSDRPHIVKGLGQAQNQLETVRKIFEEDHLPPDLAYMAIVESSLSAENSSSMGAAGLWQFTPSTARAFGLKVQGGIDERLDVRKSTRAACRYMRDLILDFGAGSSVMLALAAYNVGPSRVKQAIRRVTDPIKQRNFWYLYRVHALPEETREYVPKVIAVMIIARHPERYGF
jgi:soluble lytic murein transglycosylase-like protein